MIHRIFWGNWQMNLGLFLIMLSAMAFIAVLLGGWTHGQTTGGDVIPPPPTCANWSLNFTDPCNSNYVAAGVV